LNAQLILLGGYLIKKFILFEVLFGFHNLSVEVNRCSSKHLVANSQKMKTKRTGIYFVQNVAVVKTAALDRSFGTTQATEMYSIFGTCYVKNISFSPAFCWLSQLEYSLCKLTGRAGRTRFHNR